MLLLELSSSFSEAACHSFTVCIMRHSCGGDLKVLVLSMLLRRRICGELLSLRRFKKVIYSPLSLFSMQPVAQIDITCPKLPFHLQANAVCFVLSCASCTPRWSSCSGQAKGQDPHRRAAAKCVRSIGSHDMALDRMWANRSEFSFTP